MLINPPAPIQIFAFLARLAASSTSLASGGLNRAPIKTLLASVFANLGLPTFVAHFNFCRVHSAHKQTPAMAASRL